MPNRCARRCIRIYRFVYDTLANSSWESDNSKLLFFFLKCVTQIPYQKFTVLKIGLDHLFTEWDATILNASLFFEHLFTSESKDLIKGVQLWNQMYSSIADVDENLVNMVFQYRHLVAHSNPTKAQRKILEWKKNTGLDNEIEYQKIIRKMIWKTAKICLRAIIEDKEKYRLFQDKKPS